MITITQKKLEMFENLIFPEPMSGCWIWLGPVQHASNGDYGQFGRVDGKHISAYRFAYAAYVNPNITSKNWICHKCGNPICVNPDHLYAGNPKTNKADSIRHGTAKLPGLKNEKHAMAKFSNAKISLIKQDLASGTMSQADIARKHSISQPHLSAIKHGKYRR